MDNDLRFDRAVNELRDDEDVTLSTLEPYTELIELSRKLNVWIKADPSGIWAGHRILSLHEVKLKDLPNMPEFYVWRDIASMDAIQDFRYRLSTTASKDVLKVLDAMLKGDPLFYGIAKKEQRLRKISSDYSNEPLALGIEHTPDPNGLTHKQAIKYAPISWVPPTEWFPVCLQDLKLEDLNPLFPTTEGLLLALGIGRALVGVSNSITPSGKVIKHTSRLANVIIGEDPGLGKSIFFNKLFGVVKSLGYTVSTFKDINSQFNIGSVISSHFIYKDDISIPTLKSLLASENTKIIATGGTIRCEDKGVDAEDIQSIGTLFVNSNYYSDRFSWDLDPGIADRIKMLSTLRQTELKDTDRPEVFYTNMAKEYGVTEDVIIMWYLRLCVNYFISLISDSEQDTKNKLADEVNLLTIDLRYMLSKNSESQLFNLILYCYAICDDRLGHELGDELKDSNTPLTEIPWTDLFFHLLYITYGDYARTVIPMLYDHFMQNKGDYTHPYLALRSLDFEALYKLINDDKLTLFTKSHSEDRHTLLNKLFKNIKLNNGIVFSGDMPHLVMAWRKVLGSAHKWCWLGSEHSARLTKAGFKHIRSTGFNTKLFFHKQSLDSWLKANYNENDVLR